MSCEKINLQTHDILKSNGTNYVFNFGADKNNEYPQDTNHVFILKGICCLHGNQHLTSKTFL